MGFKQGPTTIFVDNNTASGIWNNTIKRQHSRSMNDQYFWPIDQVNLNIYRIVWAPGLDYFTKKIRRHIIVSSDHIMCKCPIHPEQLEKWI